MNERALELVRKLLQANSEANTMLKSYEMLTTRAIQQILLGSSPIVVFTEQLGIWNVFHIKDAYFRRATHKGRPVTPHECRDRQLTYQAEMYATVIHSVFELKDAKQLAKERSKDPLFSAETEAAVLLLGNLKECVAHPDVNLFHIPVMLRSNLCVADEEGKIREAPEENGGYCIIGGSEKNVHIRERVALNKILVLEKSNKTHAAILAEAQVRCEQLNKYRSASTTYVCCRVTKNSDNELAVKLPFSSYVTVLVLFRALGVVDNDHIWDMFRFTAGPCWRPEFEPIVREMLNTHSNDALTRDYALIALGKLFKKDDDDQRRNTAIRNIRRELFPHIGCEAKHDLEKAVYLAQMCNAAMEPVVLKRAKDRGVTLKAFTHESNGFDRQDSAFNTRTDSICDIFGNHIRKEHYRQVRKLRTRVNKRLMSAARDPESPKLSIINLIWEKPAAEALVKCLKSSNWNKKKGVGGGLSEPTDRMSALSFKVHFDKSIKFLERKTRLTKPRQVLPSQWQQACPYTTPEGIACGLVHSRNIGNDISMPSDPIIMIKILKSDLEIDPIIGPDGRCRRSRKDPLVSVDGVYIGTYHDPEELMAYVRHLRLTLAICPHVSVSPKMAGDVINEVAVRTDAGRTIVHLVRDEKAHVMLTDEFLAMNWNDLLVDQIIECVDIEELWSMGHKVASNPQLMMYRNSLSKLV